MRAAYFSSRCAYYFVKNGLFCVFYANQMRCYAIPYATTLSIHAASVSMATAAELKIHGFVFCVLRNVSAGSFVSSVSYQIIY